MKAYYTTGSSPKRDVRDTGSLSCSLACFLIAISGRSKSTGLLNDSDICPYKYRREHLRPIAQSNYRQMKEELTPHTPDKSSLNFKRLLLQS
jgi:hypothetical protein